MNQANDYQEYNKTSLLRLYLPILLKYSIIPYAVSFIIYIAFHIFLFNLVYLETLKIIKVIYILSIEVVIIYAVFKLNFSTITTVNNKRELYRGKILLPQDIILLAAISYITCIICVFSFLLISEFIFVRQPFTNLDFLFALAGASPQVFISSVLMIKFEKQKIY